VSEYQRSFARLLSLFRPCFTAPSFATFRDLCLGFVACVGEHTVTGMLVAARRELVWHHSRAHDFFARARWSPDELGLVLLKFLVERFVPAGAPLLLAVDDSLFVRSGRSVFGAQLHRDEQVAGGGRQARWGNSWVVLGLVVMLPFLRRPLCLPVLFRLWQTDPARRGFGKQGPPRKRLPDPAYPSKPELARALILLVADGFPGRRIDLVADGAYAARAMRALPATVSVTTRLLASAALNQPAPSSHRGRGRPALKGERLPQLKAIADDPRTRWQRLTLNNKSGAPATVDCHTFTCLWYHVFHTQPVRVLLVRDPKRRHGYDIALISTDTTAKPGQLIARYASRWTIETCFQNAKQQSGVGEARNRTQHAVERTVPFGFLNQTLAVAWYADNGHANHDVQQRRQHAPWYRHKQTPSYHDMLISLRRSLLTPEYPPTRPATQHPQKNTKPKQPPQRVAA
jgi:DDE superfamily endonuclease